MVAQSDRTEDRPDRTVLYEDGDTLIEYIERNSVADTLVVSFDPIRHLHDRTPFANGLLLPMGLDAVAVRKKVEHLYQALDRETFAAAVSPVAARYQRVVAYGSSLGAYAALYFVQDFAWTVIASSPRVSAHPVYGVDPWRQSVPFRHARFDGTRPAACAAIILYDPRDPRDRAYVEREVLPRFPAAEVIRIPFGGHPVNNFLAEIGFIAPFVRAVLTAGPRPGWRRREGRSASPSYFQVLAQTCLEHGHVAAADHLIERSLALNPNRAQAHLTRGMIKLARHDRVEARASLERVLAIDPSNATAPILLREASRRPLDADFEFAPGSYLPVEVRPALPRRVLRWLGSLVRRRPAPPRG
jgi:tetratricopeptide (TPR) repeat protein